MVDFNPNSNINKADLSGIKGPNLAKEAETPKNPAVAAQEDKFVPTVDASAEASKPAVITAAVAKEIDSYPGLSPAAKKLLFKNTAS